MQWQAIGRLAQRQREQACGEKVYDRFRHPGCFWWAEATGTRLQELHLLAHHIGHEALDPYPVPACGSGRQGVESLPPHGQRQDLAIRQLQRERAGHIEQPQLVCRHADRFLP